MKSAAAPVRDAIVDTPSAANLLDAAGFRAHSGRSTLLAHASDSFLRESVSSRQGQYMPLVCSFKPDNRLFRSGR